jgi:hypothetical protein
MKKRQIIILVSLLTVALSVSACGCLSGGKKQEKAAPAPEPAAAPAAEPATAPAPKPAPTPAPAPSVQSATPTEGQQLMDLKKAHDEGAITDEEFQRAKEKILQEGEQPTKEVAEQPQQEQKETEQKAEEEKETTK